MPKDQEDSAAFSAAFEAEISASELKQEETTPELTDAEEIAAADAEKDSAEEASQSSESVVENTQTDETTAEPVIDTQAAVVDAPSETPNYKAENERLQAELDANKATKEQEIVEDKPEVKLPDPPTAESVLSKEELGVLEAYEEEWPDVSKAEALRRKVDLAVMEDRIYREVAVALQSVLGKVNPVIESVQKTAEEKYFAAIEEAHSDYIEVGKKIDAWIEKQPAYLQPAMNAVLDSGSSADVIDLFTRFKQETGSVTPQVQIDQTNLPKTVDEATIQALTPVTGGRKQSVSSAIDPNDFERAWENAAQS